MSSGHHECLGDKITGKGCTLSLKYPGQPKRRGGNGKCKRCKEKRCADHCKCAREGKLTGRKKGRRPKSRTGSLSSSSTTSTSRPTVARPTVQKAVVASEEPKIFGPAEDQWVAAACRDLKKASQAALLVFLYDNPDLHRCLLEQLKSGRGFKLEVVVDGRQHGLRTCPFQESRLGKLKEAGAEVYTSSSDCPGLLFGLVAFFSLLM
jgi:hypothetical protein